MSIKGRLFLALMALAVLCMPVFGQTTATNVCEIRGQVAGIVNGETNLVDNYSFTWNPQNFAGFYYDIQKDLGTETLMFVLTEDNKLAGDKVGDSPYYGITYTTTAQNKAFERDFWGSYKIIGFQADRYFAGYNEGSDSGSNIFYSWSTDKNSLASEQLEKILMDKKDEMTITSGDTVKLEEDYELVIKLVDANGMYVELTKNGQVVDSKVLAPSVDGATELDKTYYYKNPAVGDQKNLVTIGVHFKNAKNIQNQTVATVDGIWQISEKPTKVNPGAQYDKMNIRSVDATNGVITMDNKDYAITLSRNKDITLMPGVNIRVANNDTFRFYIYSEKNCECG